jgi:hypothetical protein
MLFDYIVQLVGALASASIQKLFASVITSIGAEALQAIKIFAYFDHF